MKKSELRTGTQSAAPARSRTLRMILSSALVTAAAASGCVRHDAEFSHRKDYNDLDSLPQEYVHKVLDTYFGKPTEIVAWEKLPLKLHAATGTVGEGATALAVPITFTQQNLPIEPGFEAAWLSGKLLQKNQSPDLVKAIGEDGKIMFDDPGLSQIPAAGRSEEHTSELQSHSDLVCRL